MNWSRVGDARNYRRPADRDQVSQGDGRAELAAASGVERRGEGRGVRDGGAAARYKRVDVRSYRLPRARLKAASIRSTVRSLGRCLPDSKRESVS